MYSGIEVIPELFCLAFSASGSSVLSVSIVDFERVKFRLGSTSHRLEKP